MLKYNQRRPFRLSCQLFILILSLLLFSSCGGGGSSGESSSRAGSVSFNLDWQQEQDQRTALQSPSSDICADYLIETINADIRNASNESITSASWDCNTPGHTGTISGVPAGSSLYLVLTGSVSGNTNWQGQSESLTVAADQTTDAGTITMKYVGENTNPPDILHTSPVKQQGSVSLNSVINATFTEEVVPVSAESAFTLVGAGAVKGTATYDPVTWTLSFTPDEDLEKNTIYTATIAKSVEDRAGRQMAADYVWSFTTGQYADTELPSVPNLVSADAVSDTEIDLSWEASVDNVGVTYYRIYRDGTLVQSVKGTSATDKNLSPETQYCYNITALDGAENESAQSNGMCATTQVAVPPSAPTLVSPKNGALLDNNNEDLSDSIEWDFDWSDVSGATKYQIVVELGGVSFIDTELTDSSYHYSEPGKYIPNDQLSNGAWKVRAGNDQDQWSAWSGTRNFDVEPVNTDLAQDIHVPADQPTIQQGIDAASEGKKVIVAPGVYNENIKMRSGVDVVAEGPGASIVGNADVSGVVAFSSCQNTTLDGFEITVSAPDAGVDRGVVFTGSTDATAVLQNCFLYHTQYGIFVWSPAAPTIQNNTLVGEPDEQGIYIGNTATAPIIRNNIITGYSFAGIHVLAGTDTPTPVITYNDLWDNDQNFGEYPDQTGTNGNISVNPAFVGAESHNYHLSAGSDCIDFGTSEGAPDKDIDREGRPKNNGFDIGADEF